MSISRSTYYHRGDASAAAKRAKEEAELRSQIEDILAEFPAL